MLVKDLDPLLDRLNSDADYRARFTEDPARELAGVDLVPSQWAALIATDEDSLRRLSPPPTPLQRTWFSRLLCSRWFCGPPGTRNFECPKKP
jgi:hypothetical protein